MGLSLHWGAQGLAMNRWQLELCFPADPIRWMLFELKMYLWGSTIQIWGVNSQTPNHNAFLITFPDVGQHAVMNKVLCLPTMC